jgi:hypothetical protein
MRLNATILGGDDSLGKFLVVIDEEASYDQLIMKLQKTLQSSGITASVRRVLNSMKAALPNDELLGDMLRDRDEIFVDLRAGSASPSGVLPSLAPVPTTTNATMPITSMVPAPMPGGGDIKLSLMEDSVLGVLPMRCSITLPPEVVDDDESEEEDERPQVQAEDYPPPPVLRGPDVAVPGPSEDFIACKMPYDSNCFAVDHPCEPVQPTTYDNDWLVENFTPKFRDFVLEHFQEDMITEPKYVPSIGKFVSARFFQACGSFVTVFMRPQVAVGSDPTLTMPVHYNIARGDILNFQAKAERAIDTMQQHLELFDKTMRGLKGLLAKGMSDGDHIDVMLPHSYHTFNEVEGAMAEADMPILPKIDGQNPIIFVDTAGAAGRHLGYLKGALKRALHAHMPSTNSFQLIKYSRGELHRLANCMVPPTDRALQAAEAWVDELAPSYGTRPVGGLLAAVQCAVTHTDCDEIYLISSADADKTYHDAVLEGIRRANTREVAIHTIGVETDGPAELLMRYISESNHGDFLMKSFGTRHLARQSSADAKWTSWRTNLVNEKSRQMADSFKKQRMTIGSQIQIIEVMQREEKQKESQWHEEWRCAQRLLTVQPRGLGTRPDSDRVRELEQKTSRTLSWRVGGGYGYFADQVDLGLETMFEHKTMLPWTANSDTTAFGPKLPSWDASTQQRVQRFPPAPDTGEYSESVASCESTRRRPRSSRSAGGPLPPKAGKRYPTARAQAPANPWAAQVERSTPADRGRAAERPAPKKASSARAASADRAAGPRVPSTSPSGRGSKAERRKQSPARRAAPMPAPPVKVLTVADRMEKGGPVVPPTAISMELDPPGLERRWSY